MCQKAAFMHYKHPDWNIAFTFFTQALSDEIERNINRTLKSLKVERNPEKLHIFHAWGGWNNPGLFSEIRRAHGKSNLGSGKSRYPLPLNLIDLCKRTLEEIKIEPLYDAILIDEAQDFVVDRKKNPELLYQDRQPFFWLAFSAIKPSSPDSLLSRRLIWAYDEYQNISTLAIPTAKELFGDEPGFKNLLRGSYANKISKNIIMRKSYRTPGPVLLAAHVLGMGLLYSEGKIAGPNDIKSWEALGYDVKGSFLDKLSGITIIRPEKNSPNPLTSFEKPQQNLQLPQIIQFKIFDSYGKQAKWIVSQILELKNIHNLHLSRQIMIISLIPFTHPDISTLLNELTYYGLDWYIPKTPDKNFLPNYERDDSWKQNQPKKFWEDDALTITTMHPAKGNEADFVFIIGLETVAQDPGNLKQRNSLFSAMTRTKGWLVMCGITAIDEHYAFYYTEGKDLFEQLNNDRSRISFNNSGSSKMHDTEGEGNLDHFYL